MKIVDSSGKPIGKDKTAMAVFFVLKKGEWLLVKPKDVPAGLKNKDIMSCLMAGEIIETPEKEYYRAEKVKFTTELRQ